MSGASEPTYDATPAFTILKNAAPKIFAQFWKSRNNREWMLRDTCSATKTPFIPDHWGVVVGTIRISAQEKDVTNSATCKVGTKTVTHREFVGRTSDILQPLHSYRCAHMLFQLEPRLEILKPSSAGAWIMDLISIIDGSEAVVVRKGELRFGVEEGSGMALNFDTGVARLRSPGGTAEADDDVQGGEKKGVQTEISDQRSLYQDLSPQAAWETRMRIEKFEIFDLDGPASEPTTAEIEEEADRKRKEAAERAAFRRQFNSGGAVAVKKVAEPEVGEAELKKLIEGFGSGGV